jgi:hypothetical protein
VGRQASSRHELESSRVVEVITVAGARVKPGSRDRQRHVDVVARAGVEPITSRSWVGSRLILTVSD